MPAATTATSAPFLNRSDFEAAATRIRPFVHRTPLLSSRTLNELTGFDVRLKAEMFQRTGAYKIRGALNKISQLSPEQKRAGVICSSAGNHAQGVALAASLQGIKSVVVMAKGATPSKVEATKAYGAEVILHGAIWDEANEHAKQIAKDRALTMIHPFDDPQLVAGQGTLGLEIAQDWPEVELVVVPIGGGGLISGVSQAVKALKPNARIVGVESSGCAKMKKSVHAGRLVTLDQMDCRIDGLKVKRAGEYNFQVVQKFVDEIVTLPDDQIFEAIPWIMARLKVVAEGAAAAPVAALLQNLVKAPKGTKVACVLSGGNVNVDQLKGRTWN